jgi:tetratricopeptide (TPR) repeat protein
MKPLLTLGVVALLVIAFFLLLGAASPADSAEAARLNNLGAAYMNQQLFDKALKTFEAAAAKDPALKAAELNRGIALLNLQKLEQAKPVLEEAVKDMPADAYAWFNLGLYYRNSGGEDKALEAFRRVTEIDADDADSWYFLGASYAQLKRFPEAIAAFGRALKIDPLHASAQFGLARAYQQSGDTDSALPAFRKFQHITHDKLGTPISVAYGEQGKYSLAEDSPLAAQKVGPQIAVKFVDVTRETGISAKPSTNEGDEGKKGITTFGPGACFLDYDNDGRIDILLADNGLEGGIGLFHNIGGTFEEVTKKARLDPRLHELGCTTGDYDNDGFADIVLTSADRMLLFHNEKNGTFKDVTEPAGVNSESFTLGATFIDYDHDGDLDLYVTRSAMAPGRFCHGYAGSFVRGMKLPDKVCDDTLIGQDGAESVNTMWRNNGNGTFTDVTESLGLSNLGGGVAAVGADYNNDRAVDIVMDSWQNPDGNDSPNIFENPREGKFVRQRPWPAEMTNTSVSMGVAVLDFKHNGWMDLAFTHYGSPAISLWENKQGKTFDQVPLLVPWRYEGPPLQPVNWARAYGVVAFDYDNDGWVDLAAVGETKDGRGEVRLFRNLGPDGWKDVSADVGLDKIQLKNPRAIIAGDYDNDGAVDLLITQNHGPAVLLRNVGGNKNNSLRLALKGLNDNKSAIGTKVEVFSDGIRQKFEVYGSSGYLGQNSPHLTIGLGQAKQADVVRLLWPTGVLQDETEVAAGKSQHITELDRRGSSCPTLFAWDGTKYALVGDMLGAGVVGHWIGAHDGKIERNIPRPTEVIKIDRAALRERDGKLSFRFMEPLEESVYLDEAKLLAVDHPAEYDVYPNEYFASNPPYPEFKVVFSRDAKPPAGAWDEHGHDVLPSLLAHRYFGDFKALPFLGFAETHSLELDLGEPYDGGSLWLLMHGEVEYFSANSMYAADQAGLRPFAPYVEAWVEDGAVPRQLKPRSTGGNHGTAKAVPHPKPEKEEAGKNAHGKWVRVVDDLGFPAGGARTMTADLSGKLPLGTRRIRLTTNLQIYWDGILVSRTPQPEEQGVSKVVECSSENCAQQLDTKKVAIQSAHGRGARASVAVVPLVRASLSFHGFPLKVEGSPPGNVQYIYEEASVTGPYSRPAGAYTRYGDVLPLLTARDDKYVVFGSGDEVALDFDPLALPALRPGWRRDYFFVTNGYEKDMDFYAYHGDSVDPLPFREMPAYPYPGQDFPDDPEHLNYQLEYNTRFMSGNEASGYAFRYP